MKKYKELVKLKGILREQKITYTEISKRLNMSVSAFSNKINGKTLFNIVEISVLIIVLKISLNDVGKIFFE